MKIKVRGAKKSVKVSWNKVKGAKGYTVRISTSKNFSNCKTYKVKSGSKRSCNIKGLKSGKTYYIAVRATVKKSGKNYSGVLKGPRKVKTR